MGIWIVIFLILLLLALAKYRPWVYWLCVIVMVFLEGFRAEHVGTDTMAYISEFNYVADGWDGYMEPGWTLLERLVSLAGGNAQTFLVIVSAATLLLATVAFVRGSSNPQMSLFVYYAMYAYLNSFNAMRQFLAISIVLLGYVMLSEKHRLWFIIAVIVAAQVHMSSLVALPIAFVDKLPLRRSWMVFLSLFVSILIGTVAGDALFSLLSADYFHYIADNSFGYRDSVGSALLMAIAVNALFIYIYATYANSERDRLPLQIFFVGIVVMNLTYRLELGTRVILYYTVIQTLLFPQVLSYTRNYTRSVVVIAYLTVVFFKILIVGGGGVKLYENVLFS